MGRATVPLDGLWAFHPGDDLSWAQPGIDDSEWARIETGKTWEEQGFRNLTGFAWYRRQISLPDLREDADWDIGVVLPNVEDAAEAYWNGRLVGRYGRVPPDPVWFNASGTSLRGAPFPIVFDLGTGRSQPRSGLLAIRVWKAPYAYLSAESTGGLVATPILGSVQALEGIHDRAAYKWLRSNEYALGLALLSTVVSVLALLGWWRDRQQWMLFWLAMYTARPFLLLVLEGLPWVTWRLSYGLVGITYSATDAALWFLLLYLLGLRDNRHLVRWTRVFACLTTGLQLLEGAEQLFDWTRAPHFFLGADVALTIPCLLMQVWGVALVVFAFRRRLDAARWMVALCALTEDALSNANSWFDLGRRWTHWTIADRIDPTLFTIWGNPFNILSIATILLFMAIVYAVWRYEREQRQRQGRLDEEFRNAQELQQILVPESLPEIPGYEVTSAYRPAQEVGGDFFQVVQATEGGAIVVVGDVSGKGLKAAMTVALIVGALRSLVEASSDPAEILAGLNRRLCGRLRGGFATCLVARLGQEAACAMANAGHLPPFLNGDEVNLPGTLPLGLSPQTEYEETTLRLRDGDRLILYTDGLPEARNAAGELFGFTRMAKLAAGHGGADEIAAEAAHFGQEDDVTVLVIRRRAERSAASDRTTAAEETAAV